MSSSVVRPSSPLSTSKQNSHQQSTSHALHALGIGPAPSSHTPAKLSKRLALQQPLLPNKRPLHAAPGEQQQKKKTVVHTPSHQASKSSNESKEFESPLPPPAALPKLSLSLLRDIYGSCSSSAPPPDEPPQIVGGPDADFAAFEQSLHLVTGEDAIEFFARNGSSTPLKFVYCNRRPSGDEFRPYDLLVVPRAHVSPNEYFTISTVGVVSIQKGVQDTEFIPLAQWMHEAAAYNLLRSIRFFKHYLIAKIFRLWKSNVRFRIYCHQRKRLSEKLFIARPSFCAPLMDVNHLMYELDLIPLSNVKQGVYLADNFVKDQTDARNAAQKKFEEKLEKLVERVEMVCKEVKDRARQYDHRIANDDLSNSRFAAHLLGTGTKSTSMVKQRQEAEDRLKQLQHANLEADMLGDFIRLVDYIEVEHLVSRSVNTSTSFLQLLLNSNKALFQTTVSFGKERLNFAPTAYDIHHIIQSMNEGCISTVDTVERILLHPKFKPFVSPLLIDSPKVARIIHNDRTYTLTCNAINEKIDHDFHTIETTISFLEKHRPVYEFGERWNLEEYINAGGREHTVESIQRDMAQQTEWAFNIRRIRDLYDAGIFEAETKNLKYKLIPITETALAGMKELLAKIFHTKCKELQELYTIKMKLLDEDPTSLKQFASHVETFTKIKQEGKDLSERAKRIENMHRLMLEYEMQSMIPPQDEVAFDDLQQSVKTFSEQLIITEQRIEDKMISMRQTVYKNIARLNNELEQCKQQLEEGIFVDDKANPKDVVKALDNVKNTLNEIKVQTVTLQGYQVLFDTEPYPFNSLPATMAVYEKKAQFWNLYQDWKEKSKLWENSDFLTLNVEDIDREVNEAYQIVFRINKESKDSAVTVKVKNLISDFKVNVPMMLELGNKAIKQNHWRTIFTSLGQQYFPNSKITLKALKKMNIFSHRTLISDICEQAVAEYALQSSLQKVQKIWATQEFIVTPYKNKEVYLLGDVEDVLTKLEENQATLQTMLASPWIAAVQQEVELWDKKLAFLSDVMDEWLICQRNYSYLEPIFSGADIQRQLPLEAKMFADVDRFWREVMRRVVGNLNVMHAIAPQGILAQFIQANKQLDRIQKHLEQYLETKRAAFPRFYFLSNDELLSILSHARDPQAVQPHLRKCFDNIASLEFTDVPNSIEVTGMVSGEGERVKFFKPIFTRGNAETWLLEVEEMMRLTIKTYIKQCLVSYPNTEESMIDRSQWLSSWASQPILVVDQIMWTTGATGSLYLMETGRDAHALEKFYEYSKQQIAAMVNMVRGPLNKQMRQMMSSLIILDVHGRDVIEKMIAEKCGTINDFEWQKQMRHYWENTLEENEHKAEIMRAAKPDQVPDYEDCLLRQTNAQFTYRYEYLGNATRLVITPLTDRAYLTMTSALLLSYGGAPAGPAGTGKTETVKDLAKVLAVQIIVFNCSDGLTSKMMAQYFSGLAQAGAWACFDEFNRIDIEVLSVIAQQILTIQNAVTSNKSQFEFEGRMLPLDPHFGVFITMNPGYAGRTELPDNLKALFRPVAMMVPDYALIAQIVLFSEGFQTATSLSKKMVQLYKLASEQLSQQGHYDFGMRAVKSVLVMAGQLKRAAKEDVAEDVLLIRSLRDSNVPKFLSHDLPLFKGIITDLFPTVNVPFIDYGVLQAAIENQLSQANLQVLPGQIQKVIQLHETMIVRHGVMLVGATFTGKTTVLNTLANALTQLSHTNASDDSYYREVHRFTLNPKSVSLNELYGYQNAVGEWSDGLIPSLVRKAVSDLSESRKWVINDGPVDAIWIENMNTVLDDNKMLCLNNGERIKLPSSMTMVFEVEDLAVASPATVSRCGMVYLEPLHLPPDALIRNWKMNVEHIMPDRIQPIIDVLIKYIPILLKFVSEECVQMIVAVDNCLVRSCLYLMESLIKAMKTLLDSDDSDNSIEESDLTSILNMQLWTALVWSFGANLSDATRARFSTFIRLQLGGVLVPNFPTDANNVFDYFFDPIAMKWLEWKDKVAEFKYDINEPYFNILVPTSETTKYSYFLNLLVSNERNVCMMGDTGVGKTVIVQDFLKTVAAKHHKQGESGFTSISILFSAQTSAHNLQDVLETKLEKKRKNLLGAPVGKKVVLFVDDLNMPSREVYGASPPIELLRQCIDQHGFYIRSKLFFVKLQDVVYVSAMAPPGGGRNHVTQRLTRNFHHFWQTQLPEQSMSHIFTSILNGFLNITADHWIDTDLAKVSQSLIQASISVYNQLRSHMLPTPNKSHYTYNLRDLSKVIQGVCQISRKYLPDLTALLRLWLHENLRVFRDRLSDEPDRNWFNSLLSKVVLSTFEVEWNPDEFKDIIFSDMVANAQEDRDYKEMFGGQDSIARILEDQLNEYNLMFSNQMHLVFFSSAIQHLTRISRILRQPRGNALLVGVGGSGRQSLTRLAAFMAGYKCTTIEMVKNFDTAAFNEQLKKILEVAGCENKPIVFMVSDSQIVNENIVESISNLLNSGEVPNLFEHDELENIITRVRPLCKSSGKGEGRDVIFQHFIHLIRENLHIVLAFSPIGNTFRERCRRYPSIINCCTIDWYDAWSEDGLYSVAERFLSDSNLGLDTIKQEMCSMCVHIHTSVSITTKKYFKELRRYNYVTPTSYLELLKLYISMLNEQRDTVTKRIMKYRNGLNKLQSTNKMVEELQIDLVKLQPVLKKSSEEVAALLIDLEHDQKEANETAIVCQRDATQCAETTKQVQLIKDECKQDLDEAMPAYEAAIKQLDTLKKDQITIVKSFTHPPKAVQKVMEAVCLLFNVPPNWDESKKLLGKVKFLEMCKEFDKDHIPKTTLKKLQKYLQDPEFVPETLASVSEAAVCLCAWVRAMDVYSRVMKAVAPKRAALEAAENSLKEAQQTLAAKQLSLKVVEARVANLQNKYKLKQQEKDELEQNIERTKVRLVRAEKLVSGLASEELRWQQSADNLHGDLKNLVGNIILSAGSIAYLGPFTAQYRSELTKNWNNFCSKLGVPVDSSFSLIKTLSDPLIVRKWQLMGLPADPFSTENGIFVTRGRRWPLMIDPQNQANKWIKTLGKKENLQVIKLQDANYLKVLENAIRYGQPVLLENVQEQLDASIEPLLQKQIFKKGGQWLLRLSDSDVPFSPDFRFYITTKLSNPHYLPEIFVRVTICNFTVTPKGLEDQLLVVVCSLERPDLEQKNDRLIVQISDDKNELASIEDKILDLLSNATGNILDDEELIDTLAASKTTSINVSVRMNEAEQTVKDINVTRNEYRVVAERGSILYFTIADVSKVDPMYAYSLSWFLGLYRQRIMESEKSDVLATRLNTLLKDLLLSTYINMCRGLFEKDKLLFSFMMAVSIERGANHISDTEWSTFVRGGDQSGKSNILANPCDWLAQDVWISLNTSIPKFAMICDDLRDEAKSEKWKEWVNSFNSVTPAGAPLPNTCKHDCTAFQHLMLIQLFRKDKLILGIKEYVTSQLGSRFIKPPPFDLKGAYAVSTNRTPIIFILSPGANPIVYLTKLAKEKQIPDEKISMISLGQGMGKLAEELMETGRRDGNWVCLQNAHLSASFLPTLERILEQTQLEECHEDYRLFITAMPTDVFPVPILQNSIKITNEPPKGLANNIMRTFLDINEEEYEGCSKPVPYKKLLFALAFFHAVIQERRKYGPLGWNIPYEWMSSDLEVSKRQLRMYLEEQDQIPWRTLTEIIGDVNYAGRVTDDKDQRCVRSLLGRYFHPSILTDDYNFSDSGVYYAPKIGKLAAVREYIASLPDDTPEAFGLHDNADITFQLQESQSVLETLIAIQPKSSGTMGVVKTDDEIVNELAKSIEARIPADLDRKQAHESTFANMEESNTLGVFLGQEIDRYNALLKTLRLSLSDLQKAIRGTVVMSADLEKQYNSVLYNQVPAAWAKAAYPSLKSLASWIDDLCARVEFVRSWLCNGEPSAIWISAWFFPQGLLTAILQKYARATKIPIDTLKFQTHVQKLTSPAQAVRPDKGALVYGLSLQGASFDVEHGILVESSPGVLFADLPLVWLDPVTIDQPQPPNTYDCPVYKTSKRAGTLSTTGHSTNFVCYLHLPTLSAPDHWVRRGTALLLEID